MILFMQNIVRKKCTLYIQQGIYKTLKMKCSTGPKEVAGETSERLASTLWKLIDVPSITYIVSVNGEGVKTQQQPTCNVSMRC